MPLRWSTCAAGVDLISFSGILYSIYPPLFLALLVYSIGGTGTSLFLGRKLVGLNFQQEAQEANFRLAPTLPLPSCLVPHLRDLPLARGISALCTQRLLHPVSCFKTCKSKRYTAPASNGIAEDAPVR